MKATNTITAVVILVCWFIPLPDFDGDGTPDSPQQVKSTDLESGTPPPEQPVSQLVGVAISGAVKFTGGFDYIFVKGEDTWNPNQYGLRCSVGFPRKSSIEKR